MNTYFFFWLTISLSAALLELGHPGLFFFLSVTGGGIGAAISALYLELFEYQLVMFVAATSVTALVLRYGVLTRWSTHSHYHSNVHALQGKQARVVQSIPDHGVGTVKIGGEIWSARAISGSAIPEGGLVEVVQVVGAHVKVKKVSS